MKCPKCSNNIYLIGEDLELASDESFVSCNIYCTCSSSFTVYFDFASVVLDD